MTQELQKNVFVADVTDEGQATGQGSWYGPDYPENEVTAAVLKRITNPGAFEDDSARSHPTGVKSELADGIDPNDVDDDELDELSKDALQAVAAARSVELPARATKAQIVDAIRAAAE